MYYHCGEDYGIIKEEIVHVTPDLKHDDNAVNYFIEKTLAYLELKGVEIQDIQEFTNHCRNQYKSKNIFYNLSQKSIPVTHHYFAVKHRKGPSDHAGANYKNFVKRIIKDPHRIMTTCRDLAEFSYLNMINKCIVLVITSKMPIT